MARAPCNSVPRKEKSRPLSLDPFPFFCIRPNRPGKTAEPNGNRFLLRSAALRCAASSQSRLAVDLRFECVSSSSPPRRGESSFEFFLVLALAATCVFPRLFPLRLISFHDAGNRSRRSVIGENRREVNGRCSFAGAERSDRWGTQRCTRGTCGRAGNSFD